MRNNHIAQSDYLDFILFPLQAQRHLMDEVYLWVCKGFSQSVFKGLYLNKTHNLKTI